jgi:hypothetical protein
VDKIPLIKNVVFIGEYFSLITTVSIDDESESLREEGDDDSEFAIKLASEWLKQFYGWDVHEAALTIGVSDDGDLVDEPSDV